MFQKLCIYDNKIFVVFDNYLRAYSYKKNFNTEEHFSECRKIKLPSKCLFCDEISLEVVENYITGLKSLIILTFDVKVPCSAFICNNSLGYKLHEIVLPFVPAVVDDYSNCFFVSNGPTFLFHSSNTSHLFSLPLRKNDSLSGLLPYRNLDSIKILLFKCFGPFIIFNSLRYLYLQVICYGLSNKPSIEILGFVYDDVNRIICEKISLCSLIPEYYSTTLKTIDVLSVTPCFKKESVTFKDIEWVESLCIICTKDEFLVFSNAILTYCCKLRLPILTVMSSKSQTSDVFPENKNIVLMLENKTAYFISMQKTACEVVKYWADIETIMIGDILGKGSEQMLLLEQADYETWQNNCILYEMISFIPIDLTKQHAMPDTCLKTTITGLKKKVQEGKLLYKDVEQEISQKSTATIDALVKLNEFKANKDLLKHSQIFQESLIDLILSKDENKTAKLPPKCEPSVILLEYKQRFLNNCWVILLSFKNESEKSICHPGMKMLIKGSQVMCMQKLFVHSSDTFSVCDKNNCEIKSKGRFTILMRFELPSFDDDISLILTWYSGSKDEFDNEIFLEENRKVLIQHQFFTEIKITMKDVLNYQFKSASPIDLFLLASQQKIKFSVSSLHSNVRKLEDLLIKNDSASKNLQLVRNSSTKCISFQNQNSLLFGINMVFLKSEENIAEIEAYTKNETEILLLIQYLYDHLPDDIIISPHMSFKDELSQIKRQAASFLKNELDLLISSLTIYNVSDELRGNYSKLMSSQNTGNVIISKTAYNRIRTALVKKEFMTDSMFKKFIGF